MGTRLLFICLLGALTIGLGAFGAHSLQETLTSEQLQSFETAVRYQFFHVLILLILNLYEKLSAAHKKQLTYIFVLGISCFSGSIYAITAGVPAKSIWFITPLGGILFMIGWIKLGWNLYKTSRLLKNK